MSVPHFLLRIDHISAPSPRVWTAPARSPVPANGPAGHGCELAPAVVTDREHLFAGEFSAKIRSEIPGLWSIARSSKWRCESKGCSFSFVIFSRHWVMGEQDPFIPTQLRNKPRMRNSCRRDVPLQAEGANVFLFLRPKLRQGFSCLTPE